MSAACVLILSLAHTHTHTHTHTVEDSDVRKGLSTMA